MSYFKKGNECYNNGKYEEAIKHYYHSIKYNEYEEDSYYNSGVCCIKLKDFENAIGMIEAALEYSKESKYFFNIGYCYSMLKDNQTALRFFNLAWALDNNDKDCEKAINIICKKLKIKRDVS